MARPSNGCDRVSRELDRVLIPLLGLKDAFSRISRINVSVETAQQIDNALIALSRDISKLCNPQTARHLQEQLAELERTALDESRN